MILSRVARSTLPIRQCERRDRRSLVLYRSEHREGHRASGSGSSSRALRSRIS
ncbi:MAG: hypothetical protein MZV64_31565 [Ignavibacteriales bacterium]|nr:hypothetical protein [Ignavibacteriales bacterium]